MQKDAFETSGSSPGKTSADFTLCDEGTIFLLTPHNKSARTWLDQHIGPANGFQPWYATVVIEHRYIADILEGLRADRLEIQ